MTPEPALWNWRSRGLASGGASKKRRKNGSSNSGLRPERSLMVPRVAIFTTAGETRLTMGASEGIGAASGAGVTAYTGALKTAAASAASANLRRRFMRSPLGYVAAMHAAAKNKAGLESGPARQYRDFTLKDALSGSFRPLRP